MENLYELLIFQGYKNLVYYQNFQENSGPVCDRQKLNDILLQHRIQNIYGVSEGLKMFSQSFSSEAIQNFRYILTTQFKFTIFEISSGVKIILLSQINDQNEYYPLLKDIYFQGYLELVKRNSFYKQGDSLNCPYFLEFLKDSISPYLKKL